MAFSKAIETIINKFNEHEIKINQARDLFINLVTQSPNLNINCQPEANVTSVRLNSKEENIEILKRMENADFIYRPVVLIRLELNYIVVHF